MWQRFTERARRVILLGQEEATRMNSGHVGTEHLLLGLLREDAGVAAQILARTSLTLEAARREIQAQSPPSLQEFQEPKLTNAAKRVLELCADEARRMRHNYIGTEHLLLALLREKNDLAAKVMSGAGVRLDDMRHQVSEYLGPTAEKPPRPSANFSFNTELQTALYQAAMLAGWMDSKCIGNYIGIEHMLLVLLFGHPTIFNALGDAPLDAEQAAARLAGRLGQKLPPRELRDLLLQGAALIVQRDAAVEADEYEKAAELRDQAKEVEQRLEAAIKAWREQKEDEEVDTG